jgi:hypothetical protein
VGRDEVEAVKIIRVHLRSSAAKNTGLKMDWLIFLHRL